MIKVSDETLQLEIPFYEHYRLRKTCKKLNSLTEKSKVKTFGSDWDLIIDLADDKVSVEEMVMKKDCIILSLSMSVSTL